MTLNEFANGLPVAQAKAPWQLEIDAMAVVAKTMEPLDGEARARVLRWLAARFVPMQMSVAEQLASERQALIYESLTRAP